MYAPMIALAACCVALGLSAPWVVPMLAQAVGSVTGLDADTTFSHLAPVADSLGIIVAVGCILLALIVGLTCLRWLLLRGREVKAGETWGCGYARPTARMQYTSSSFGQPLTDLFTPVLRTAKHEPVIDTYFPQQAALATATPEPFRESLYEPTFRGVGRGLNKLRWLQHGRVQVYVLYIAVTILFLLVWYLGLGA
jgi:hypothetical protein